MTERRHLHHGLKSQMEASGWKPKNETMPAIGRLVLNPEAVEPAYEYLRQRSTLEPGSMFRALLVPDDYRGVPHADPQSILDTLPEHARYSADFATNPLDCRIGSLTWRVSGKGRQRRAELRVTASELFSPGRLQDERAMLTDHLGIEGQPNSKQVRWIPLGTISDFELTLGLLGKGVSEFLTGTGLHLGPIQLEPQTESGQRT